MSLGEGEIVVVKFNQKAKERAQVEIRVENEFSRFW